MEMQKDRIQFKEQWKSGKKSNLKLALYMKPERVKGS